MKNSILISIIIPVYNVDKYVGQCLESVISQSYSNFEAIVIDDGSTDLSGEIAESYARTDSRIKVFHQKNQGAANAKNTALEYVKGSYITFLDSDDFVEPNWLDEMMKCLKRNDADIVECNFNKVFLNHIEQENKYEYDERIYDTEKYLLEYLENWYCALFWNKLFKKEVCDNIRFRKERRCIDDEFFTYKVVSNATRIVRLNQVLYHYRQRKSSAVLSVDNSKQIIDDSLEILLERYFWICKYFPLISKNYLLHDIDILYYYKDKYKFSKNDYYKMKKILFVYFVASLKEGLIGKAKGCLQLILKKKEFLNEKEDKRVINADIYFP